MTYKNKQSAPFRKALVRLNYTDGWDGDWSLLNFAKDRKIVAPKARGKAALEQARKGLGWTS